MLKKADKLQSFSSLECELEQFSRLKRAAQLHMGCSEVHISLLRSIRQSHVSELEHSAWKCVKEGSYFLKNAHHLVETYKKCMSGAIDDKNIQLINTTLEKLEFDPKHITSGYTYEAYDGKVVCFVSKGQGTLYYKLLHSELKKDVRLFTDMVEHDINIPVKRFLEYVNQKLQAIYLEKLFKAIEINNISAVKNCIKEGAIVNLKDTTGKTPLHYAVNNANIDITNNLLISGADATQVNNKNCTPLYIAASKGYKEIVKVLIQHVSRDKLNDFINFKTTSDATTSLHVAAKNAFLDIVKFLLKCGATYNIQNKNGKTPCDLSKEKNIINLLKLIGELFEDAKDGNLEIISKLKTVKFDEFVAVVNARNIQKHTLMQVAIANKHKIIATKLKEMVIETNNIQSSLREVAQKHLEFSELYLPMLRRTLDSNGSEKNPYPVKMLKKGSYFLGNAYNLVETYKTCMPGAIDDKNIQLINATLVELEFDPKHITSGCTDEPYDGTALCFVSKGQDTVYYKMLNSELKKDVRLFIDTIERDIDIPVKKFLEFVNQNLQPIYLEKLFKAIEINDVSAVKNCIKEGAIVNSKDTDGKTPLHYAVINGNIDIINNLLTSGADVTQADNKNYTPLYLAVLKGYKEIVKVVSQHVKRDKLNEFISVKTTSDGNTLLHVAAKNNFLDIVKFLLKCGATYNVQNKKGKTPCDSSKEQNIINLLKLIGELFEDAKNGNLEIISKLKAVKPDEFAAVVNARNDEKQTIMQVARANKHKSIEAKLIEILIETVQSSLRGAAKLHLSFSDSYLPMLRRMSDSYGSEINYSPWSTVKEGSYFLGNAYHLVETYKDCIPGAIDDKNMQLINDTLVELGFDRKHISAGYTEEAYGGQVECFVSKGQGTVYYDMLHSDLKKDIRIFIEMVERNIDHPVKMFLESVEQKSFNHFYAVT